ncbi:helix-turn-helix domain-containing protein [Qipengyuania sp. MTN3-11]|uniref:helix-turn-helix domain-containing protein n=1 Tax=Qipengyuania sp. MTN3-11 TaxID=3056557 RepID=UPI0036F249A1
MDTPQLEPVTGMSRDGRPLAHHRAPAPDLAPWVARLFVTAVEQPADQTLSCFLLNDTAFVRIIVAGEWAADAVNGRIACSRGTLMFGPHSRRMPIGVRGPFYTFGFALNPGALTALGHPWGKVDTDCIALAPEGTPGGGWLELAESGASPEVLLNTIEADLRAHIFAADAPPPDPLAAAFDLAAFADPGEPIRSFARRYGVTARRVERMAGRAFGMTPRAVMRRARVLDMASQLLGLADDSEAAEHALRFYDQSHLIRDFKLLLGCTPRQLISRPRPILSLGLDPRQARRLELLGRVDAGAGLPWRTPPG